MEQIKPFGPVFHFGERLDTLKRVEGGFEAATMPAQPSWPRSWSSAGGGSFTPKRPPLAGIEAFEDKSVFYAVRKMDAFRGKLRHRWRRALGPSTRR